MNHPRGLRLPPGDFEAYLFDCDGTIADTMPVHYLAWNAALEPHGCVFTLEEFYGWAGMPTAKIVARLNELRGLEMPVADVLKAKERRFLELLPRVKGVPEVVELIGRAHGTLPFAVVSGGLREVVHRTLDTLKLRDRFQTIVTAEDYTRGKPEPEAFLLAAERLGVNPAKCLVFEDAELGIEAARRAGMAWVKVEPESHQQAFRRGGGGTSG